MGEDTATKVDLRLSADTIAQREGPDMNAWCLAIGLSVSGIASATLREPPLMPERSKELAALSTDELIRRLPDAAALGVWDVKTKTFGQPAVLEMRTRLLKGMVDHEQFREALIRAKGCMCVSDGRRGSR